MSVKRSVCGLESSDTLLVAKRGHELPYLRKVLSDLGRRAAIIPTATEAIAVGEPT
ncbi:MAG: hypothetical protein AAFX93_10540 [Verrucomicrobiota bacterium]